MKFREQNILSFQKLIKNNNNNILRFYFLIRKNKFLTSLKLFKNNMEFNYKKEELDKIMKKEIKKSKIFLKISKINWKMKNK